MIFREGHVEDVTPQQEGERPVTAENREQLREMEAKLKEEAQRIQELGIKASEKELNDFVAFQQKVDKLREQIERGYVPEKKAA